MTTSARFENTPKINFNNKILIIIDPCYIIKDDIEKDDWEKCEYGINMEELGFTNYLTHDTIYGDWDCFIYAYEPEFNDYGKELGELSADSGLVSVFDLDEVLKYNSEFDYKWYIEHNLATIIENFTGDVWIEANEDSSYAIIHGVGNINFISDMRTYDEINKIMTDYDDDYNFNIMDDSLGYEIDDEEYNEEE